MKERAVLDLRDLPMHGMGSASVTWWGTLGFMLIEGSGFADLGPGTIVTVMLLISVAPNILISRWAARQELRKVQIGMLVMVAFGVAPLILRFYEFSAMHVRWDSNAYGSSVWTLLGLHLTHLVTDLGDTIVLAVIMFTKHGSNKRRFGDVQDNALYWNFVVLAWLPIYACIYWIPRL
jgi:cytochrome c oxidase subunit 3